MSGPATGPVTEPLSRAQLAQLGRTEGAEPTLAALAASQHTQRLLLLRVLLDALPAAPAPAAALAHEHAALLESAERAAPAAARRVLFYPLTGTWAERCARRLTTGGGQEAARDLGHLGGLAAAAALRAGLDFRLRVDVGGGRLALPTLGAVSTGAPDGTPAELTARDGGLTLRLPDGPPLVIRPEPSGGWRSTDPRWLPLHTLGGGPRPVLLDDLDPSRPTPNQAGDGPPRHALRPAERAHWSGLWAAALPLLRLGGAARAAELTLLNCIVPLLHRGGGRAGHVSSTSAGAFGAVLASAPPSAALLAAGLTHELQHAKLAAVQELNPLHHEGPRARHWAPWRPDPRPFDGLLHGAYAHLALAGFWQQLALGLADPAARDQAWAAHCRAHTQVGAVLPTLRAARRLTDDGRLFVAAMADRHGQLGSPAPPEGHLVRARAYVETARAGWLRQHARGTVT
ncbi:HEXXH motif-containing putative peptide modification protein [Streptomyces sp. DSM 44915]|uniref:HEXXH motif-containing putative peptide modification protein n=1 Tax=Streptomyces chisholmiae TaxID=3075540 RepID=A0ABU2JLN6_9ACTN|nr:HEXXH motif-containing putative peptide modification protein [Streptomyces sp. DSM 44915]MDT0265648.1 HEXXH motif-containing putative peptide modification protein [Streptomyces sp. DSM 44915]